MKDDTRILPRLASVLVLTLTLLTAVSAQSMSPSGAFGFLINASYNDPSNETGLAILGVMDFDGAGNVKGSYTFEVGSSAKQSSQPLTGTLTGTYSSNPDGTGSVTITSDIGITLTFAMVITDGGQGLQLLATNCSGGCSIGGTTTIAGVARAAYVSPLKGSYGFLFNLSPQPAGNIGVASFDGAGNAAMSLTFVGLSGTDGQPSVITGTQAGTYSVNPDGTGTMQFGNQTYAIVVTDGGSGLLLLQTNRAGDGVSFGTARLQ
jgi:hypothetical protein